jgi:alpha-galactosidase
MDVFGAYPDRIGHTKEYVPFFQGYGVTPCDPPPLALFDADERARKMAERWSETRKFAYGRKPLAEFLATGRGDHATDIIESMWGGLGKPFYVSTANRGAIPNFADDAFLELRSHLDMHGPRPQAVGEMPLGVAGLSRLVLDTHELTAEAAVQCDRGLLLRALATDPIVNNLSDAKKIMEELLVIERDALPAGWFRKRAGR